MYKYEKPVAEIINLIPADQMMGGWNDDNESWGDNEDWGEAEDWE